MIRNVRLAIAQIDCTVGDFDGNFRKISECLKKAVDSGADIISFPELAVTGYPPEDLLLKPRFIDDNLETIKKISKAVPDAVAVVGFVDKAGQDIYNAAAVIYDGAVRGIYHKMLLPNYGVFDEKRYFKPGRGHSVFGLGEISFGVNICEDIWHKEGPLRAQVADGANLIININASPYHSGKSRDRERIVCDQARSNKVAISYANLVGGQDELVFDGQSMVVDGSGKVVARAGAFKEDLLFADIDIRSGDRKKTHKAVVIAKKMPSRKRASLPTRELQPIEPMAEIYRALALGLKDYVVKNGFTKVVVGLSGGIDSSLVASLACDALGKENAIGVFMPTHYSSAQSEADAKALAANLGMKFLTLSIDHLFKIYLLTLEPHFAGTARDITEENLQARIRGTILMALSNKFGWLVLATGNKSEMSTGYATLYGDMAGGLAVIKDVPKTLVYKLAKYRNSVSRVIPESVITREPTAELRPDQKDRDTLPPYDVLDKIIKAYVEEDMALNDIVRMGLDKDIALKVINMVDKSEYKRRQSPPGIKITHRAFGRDRRMPITSRYR